MVGADLLDVLRVFFGSGDLQLDDETSLESLPGWDSLTRLSLMFAVEQEYGIEFGEDEFADVSTVGELRDLVLRKSSGR